MPASRRCCLPSGASSPPCRVDFAQSLACLALPLAHLAAPPKSFFAPLTAPMTTASTALPTGAWTLWMIDWIFSETAEAEQARQERDRQRQRAGQRVLHLLRDDPDVALGDGADRVQDR